MIEIKAQTLPPEKVDYSFIAKFTFNANRAKCEKMGLNIEKIQTILQENFRDDVYAYIFVYEDGILAGWLLLYKKNIYELILNPGETLGGFPIVGHTIHERERVTKLLLSRAINIVKDSYFKSVELIFPLSDDSKQYTNMIVEAGYRLKLVYNDMKCNLSEISTPKLAENYNIKKIDDLDASSLYACYIQSFERGKAQFFKQQSNKEKRNYFEELYTEENADSNLSIALEKENCLIGFAFVLEFDPGIKHISCMCVHPDHQKQGAGSYLLNYIMKYAKEEGAHTITLGTEPQMVAYQLYRNHGFKDVISYNIYGWNKEKD